MERFIVMYTLELKLYNITHIFVFCGTLRNLSGNVKYYYDNIGT